LIAKGTAEAVPVPFLLERGSGAALKRGKRRLYRAFFSASEAVRYPNPIYKKAADEKENTLRPSFTSGDYNLGGNQSI
jgi:hypothetical protein